MGKNRDLKELIKLGIVVSKNHEVNLDGKTVSVYDDIWEISAKYKNRLFDKIRFVVDGNATLAAGIEILKIEKKLKFAPVDLKKKLLSEEFENLIKEIDKFFVENGNPKPFILDDFGLKEYLSLYNDELKAREILGKRIVQKWNAYLINSKLQKFIGKKIEELSYDETPERNHDVKIGSKQEIPSSQDSPFPRIFPQYKHFELFELMRKQITKNELAEFSFVYWSMYNDGFLFEGLRPKEYIDWLGNVHGVILEKLKQLHLCKGGGKIKRYEIAKEFLKL